MSEFGESAEERRRKELENETEDPLGAGPNFLGTPTGPRRLEKRLGKIRTEIDRNRRGEYKVPTWVLVACLILFVAAWAAWIIIA